MMDAWATLIAMGILVAGGLFSFWTYTRRTYAAVATVVLLTLAALYVGFRRDTYLPFLGKTVMPCSLLELRVPEHADTEVNVSGLKPGAKVLYWASEPATDGLAKINDWQKAYLEFANAGVTRVSQDGHAVFRFRKPQPYTVPVMGKIESHVHWRVCQDGGMIGPVQITPISQ